MWDQRATKAIIRAAWTSRGAFGEKVAQIVAAHRVDAALDAVVGLSHDPIPRVRNAAARALRNLADRPN